VTLFVLDTDHLSLYQRDAEPLLSKLLSHPPDELAITIVTVEEQLRGRLAQIRKATTAAHLNECYRWLGETVDQLARLPVLYFDDKAGFLSKNESATRSLASSDGRKAITFCGLEAAMNSITSS